MKRAQRGEVMLAVMAVMLVVAWLGRGHVGMMGMGHVAAPVASAVEPTPAAQAQGTPHSTPLAPAEQAN